MVHIEYKESLLPSATVYVLAFKGNFDLSKGVKHGVQGGKAKVRVLFLTVAIVSNVCVHRNYVKHVFASIHFQAGFIYKGKKTILKPNGNYI